MHHLSPSRWILLAVVAVVLSALPAGAHHGWSGYGNEAFELTGTVETDVRLGGAHATMRIKAQDGQVWDVVLAPEPRTSGAGLKEGMIPLGAKVTASGHRHRDPKKFEIKTERLTYNGKVYNVYPNRS